VTQTVFNATLRTQWPPKTKITRPTVQLSLIMTPRSDAGRDDFSLAERLEHLDEALAKIRELALFWPTTRCGDELFEDFEVQLRDVLRAAGRALSSLPGVITRATTNPTRSRFLARTTTPSAEARDSITTAARKEKSASRSVIPFIGEPVLEGGWVLQLPPTRAGPYPSSRNDVPTYIIP